MDSLEILDLEKIEEAIGVFRVYFWAFLKNCNRVKCGIFRDWFKRVFRRRNL